MFYNTFFPPLWFLLGFFPPPPPISPPASSGYRGRFPPLGPFATAQGGDRGRTEGTRGGNPGRAGGVRSLLPLPARLCCQLAACTLAVSFPVPTLSVFWPANFNLKLDWADLMQIPPGKTLKLMNSYVKSILHHREKVTSARKKNNKVKETRAFHV